MNKIAIWAPLTPGIITAKPIKIPNIPDLKGVILPNDSGEIYIDFDKYGWMIEGSDEDKAELESELKTKIQQHKPYFVCL